MFASSNRQCLFVGGKSLSRQQHIGATLLVLSTSKSSTTGGLCTYQQLKTTRRRASNMVVLVRAAASVENLYEAAQAEAVGILYHPFTKGSLTGSLPPSSVPDFLRDEAQLMLAAASLAKQPTVKIFLLKDADLWPNDSLVSDEAKAMRNFMMDAGDEDCTATAALLAFLHARAVLDQRLGSTVLEKDTSSWLTGYGTSEFQACAYYIEEDLESQIRKSKGATSERVLRVFKETLKHQMRVLSAAYSGPSSEDYTNQLANPWHPANLLFTTDYDVTCTVEDTSEVLVTVAQSNRGCSDLEAAYWSLMKIHDTRIKACLSLWEHDIVTAKLSSAPEDKQKQNYFIQGMDSELKNLISEFQDALPAAEKFENRNLRDILRKLGDLEKRINKEVMAAGVLRGATRQQVRQEVKNIPLHSRCSEVLVKLAALDTPVHYISATWSKDLVLGGLPPLPKGLLLVHSNDLRYDQTGTSTGTFEGVVQDAFDKEAILQTLEKIYEKQAHAAPKMTVFLGDSTNDLLALLNADLGIVIGQNPALREMLSRCNLQLLPLVVAAARISASIQAKKPTSFRRSGILFHASGWAEVEACLLSSNCNQLYEIN